MDLFKKIFGLNQHQEDPDSKNKSKGPGLRDEFRKPNWFEEYETDDELFDNNKSFSLQIFANPMEFQKHFEKQMQDMLKSFEEYDDQVKFFDNAIHEDFFKPAFEKHFKRESVEQSDTDLDGEINKDKIQLILEHVSPIINSSGFSSSPNFTEKKEKRTDEDSIMDRIHGTYIDEDSKAPVRRRVLPKIPHHHPNIEGGPFNGTKMFHQSIITKTIRKPDGSVETQRVVRDSEGNTKTTITQTIDGETKTVASFNSKDQQQNSITNSPQIKASITDQELKPQINKVKSILDIDRNFIVNQMGYTLPKNMW